MMDSPCKHEHHMTPRNWRPPKKTNDKAWKRVEAGEWLWDRRLLDRIADQYIWHGDKKFGGRDKQNRRNKNKSFSEKRLEKERLKELIKIRREKYEQN